MRIINKVGYYDSTDKLFIQNNILKLRNIVNIKILEIIFKSV